MSRTSTTGRERQAVTRVRRGCYGSVIKAVAGATTICAMFGAALVTIPGSAAASITHATPKAHTAAAECSTVGHSGIPGVVINETKEPLKRYHVEHGAGTGFFQPEPAAEVPAETIRDWCVGSHFGVEAMKVDYKLPDGAEAHFAAYYGVFGIGLQTSCSVNKLSTRYYGCAAERVGPNFRCSPYVGCVGPLRNKDALKGVDVVFRVFPK